MVYIALRGFSIASTTPCCKAVKDSLNATGVGFAPSDSMDLIQISVSGTRIFRPCISSRVSIGSLDRICRLARNHSQRRQSSLGKALCHNFTRLAVNTPLQVVQVLEEVRHRHQVYGGIPSPRDFAAGYHHVQVSVADHFTHGSVIAQLGVGIELDDQLTSGRFLHQIGQLQQIQLPLTVLRVIMGDSPGIGLSAGAVSRIAVSRLTIPTAGRKDQQHAAVRIRQTQDFTFFITSSLDIPIWRYPSDFEHRFERGLFLVSPVCRRSPGRFKRNDVSDGLFKTRFSRERRVKHCLKSASL